MTRVNRFQNELATTALTLLLTSITITRKTQLGYIKRPQESSVHKSMRWTLMYFLAPCLTSVPLPSSPPWVQRRNTTNSPKYSHCVQIHFHHPLFALRPPKCFPVLYTSHCTLLHNKFKPYALSDPPSPKLSPSCARALPLGEYNPKTPQKGKLCPLPGSPADSMCSKH